MQSLESVAFKDVAIDFPQEEWAMLDTSQRKLFRDVMAEIINHLFSVGKAHDLKKQEIITIPNTYRKDASSIMSLEDSGVGEDFSPVRELGALDLDECQSLSFAKE